MFSQPHCKCNILLHSATYDYTKSVRSYAQNARAGNFLYIIFLALRRAFIVVIVQNLGVTAEIEPAT